MTTVRTDLRETVESARRIRFEPVLPITATNVEDAINQVVQVAGGIAPPLTPVNVAMSPYQVVPSDRLLAVDTSGGPVTINMMPSASRLGVMLEVKDDTGHAQPNPISVVMSGAETADGLATYTIDSNYGAAQFVPQNGGYFIDA